MIYSIEMFKYAKELKIISEHNKEKFLTHRPLKKDIRIMGTKINTDENGFRKNEITVDKNLSKILLLGDLALVLKLHLQIICRENFIKILKLKTWALEIQIQLWK